MNIKFIESHSFVGEHMAMVVNGTTYHLERSNERTYEQHAVEILKKVYDVDFNIDDVKFKWDGTL